MEIFLFIFQVESPPPVISPKLKEIRGGMGDMVPGEEPITSEDALSDFEAPPEIDNTTKAMQAVSHFLIIQNARCVPVLSQSAFYVNLYRAVIGPSG